MTKILVADDEVDLETLIRQKFRQKIRQQEYEFVFAINGNDAIRKIEQHPDIDMVLSDINMPEMDGLTLLSALGASNPLLENRNGLGLWRYGKHPYGNEPRRI